MAWLKAIVTAIMGAKAGVSVALMSRLITVNAMLSMYVKSVHKRRGKFCHSEEFLNPENGFVWLAFAVHFTLCLVVNFRE